MGLEDSEHALAHHELLAELGWVRALAHRLVSDPDVADDVLQRVCLVALEKRPRHVSGVAGIRRWLSTLTRRTAVHSQRSASRRARREERAAREERLPSTVDVAARREVLHQLVDALSDLEAGDRLLLTQRYFDGLGIAEIAGRLELSEASARQRLSRARRRLRERLERDAGKDRERWLAALGPVVLAPAAFGPSAGQLVTASRAELARQSAQTVLSSPVGGVVMAKIAGSLVVKVVVGLGVMAAAVVTTLQVLDAGDGAAVGAPGVIRTVDSPLPGRTSLPVVVDAPLANVLDASEDADAAPDASADFDRPVEPHVRASELAMLLDDATASFVTTDPDLQALNEALRQLAFAARVLPDSVAKDPSDGSIKGWVEIEGTDLKAAWSRSESGRCEVEFEMAFGDYTEPFVARDLAMRFTDDRGRASDVTTYVNFHPDTSEKNFDNLLTGLKTGVTPVGWALSVGPLGTTGNPSTMRISDDGTSVVITGQEAGVPSFTESWANDTSAYDAWLSVLSASLP